MIETELIDDAEFSLIDRALQLAESSMQTTTHHTTTPKSNTGSFKTNAPQYLQNKPLQHINNTATTTLQYNTTNKSQSMTRKYDPNYNKDNTLKPSIHQNQNIPSSFTTKNNTIKRTVPSPLKPKFDYLVSSKSLNITPAPSVSKPLSSPVTSPSASTTLPPKHTTIGTTNNFALNSNNSVYKVVPPLRAQSNLPLPPSRNQFSTEKHHPLPQPHQTPQQQFQHKPLQNVTPTFQSHINPPSTQQISPTTSSKLPLNQQSGPSQPRPSTQFSNLPSPRQQPSHSHTPYQKIPPNQTFSSFPNQQQSPYKDNQQPNSPLPTKQATYQITPPSVCITVNLQLVSGSSFEATVNLCTESLQSVFHQAGGKWDEHHNSWLFPLNIYKPFFNALRSTKNIQVNSPPENIVRIFCNNLTQNDVDVNLERIPTDLLNQLLPFQQKGVIFGVKKGGRCLIGDEMGLGKTIQAIALCCYYSDEWPVLVITPSSLRLPWADQFERWVPSLGSADIRVIMNGKCEADGKVNIVSYDLVGKLDLMKKNFKIVIADESHFLKNLKAKRTVHTIPLLLKAKRAILLTGTPALSRPVELYGQISALAPCLFSSVYPFGLRYCDLKKGKFGIDYSGSSNLRELHALLERTFMIRRLKDEVLTELPPKRREKIHVLLKRDHSAVIKKIRRTIKDQFKIINESGPKEKRDACKAKSGLFMELFCESGIAKLPAVIAYIEDMLEGSEKFLVFAHHKDVLDGISRYLTKNRVDHIKIDGSTLPQLRYELVNHFQEVKDCRVAVLSITAAGTGLTLTAASMIIFAELYWNPGVLFQAEDRAHRIGQLSSVTVKYLVGRGTVDEMIWDLIDRKLDVLGQALNGTQQTVNADAVEGNIRADEGFMDEFIEQILSRIDTFDERDADLKNKIARRALAVQRAKDDSLFLDSESEMSESEGLQEEEEDFVDNKQKKRKGAVVKRDAKKKTSQKKIPKQNEVQEDLFSRGKRRLTSTSNSNNNNVILVNMENYENEEEEFDNFSGRPVEPLAISALEETNNQLEDFRFSKKTKN